MDNIEFIESTVPWLFPLFVFIFGAIVGSFLNVCIYRIPKGESVMWPPSHSSTGRRLSWWENVPVLAWFYLGGKDRVTRERYSFRYPFVEFLTAVLFVLCWNKYEPVVAVVGMLFMVILVVSTFIDIDHMIIPDSFSIGGTLVGCFLAFWIPQMHIDPESTSYLSDGFVSGLIALISALAGAGLVFWVGEIGEVIFRKPAMGLGDVKLVGCIGAFCGWEGAVFSLFGGAIAGSILLVPWMLIQKFSSRKHLNTNSEQTDENLGFGLEIPFGPMLTLGAALYYLGFDKWVDEYFASVTQMIFGQL